MQNSMVFFTFFVQTRNTLLEEIGPQNEDCQLQLKFGTQDNSNMQNSMTMFTCSLLDRKYLFWSNFLQKVKIVSLS